MRHKFFFIFGATVILATMATMGCSTDGQTQGSGDPGMTKDDVRNMGKADWLYDYCEEMGWYGDGVCDEFCPQPDPDCGGAKCGPIPNGACAEGQVCNIGSCRMGDTGFCLDRPEFCPMDYSPVCGCDGNTYSNDCHRLQAGVPLDHDGACEQEEKVCGPIANGACAEGQVCNIGSCRMGDTGFCLDRPEFCPMDYSPVCGCNGNTYSNDCHRLQAGVPLDHDGECD
ncbi:MAG: hypothetical protein J7M25_11090 [Deltaproteobacteria bacterium]|nr:hypothetical protein [Deltaproteobacteria bacterium]